MRQEKKWDDFRKKNLKKAEIKVNYKIKNKKNFNQKNHVF